MIGTRPQTMAAKLQGELTVRQALQDPSSGSNCPGAASTKLLARCPSLGRRAVVEFQP